MIIFNISVICIMCSNLAIKDGYKVKIAIDEGSESRCMLPLFQEHSQPVNPAHHSVILFLSFQLFQNFMAVYTELRKQCGRR